MKLAAAEPLIVICGGSDGNGFRTADQRGSFKTAALPGIVGEQGGLPNADGENALLDGAEIENLQRLRDVPHGAWRKLAVAADERAVPIDFVGIANFGEEKEHLPGRTWAWGERDGTPVPGEICQVRVALFTPRLVRVELFPLRGVERGTGPCGIVSRVKLPWPIERERSLAEAFNRDRGDWCGHLACLVRMRHEGGDGEQSDGGQAAEGKLA